MKVTRVDQLQHLAQGHRRALSIILSSYKESVQQGMFWKAVMPTKAWKEKGIGKSSKGLREQASLFARMLIDLEVGVNKFSPRIGPVDLDSRYTIIIIDIVYGVGYRK